MAVAAAIAAFSPAATASGQTPVTIDDPPAPRQVQEKTVTTVERPTEIRSWKGIGAFSVYDQDGRVHRLAVTRAGGAPELLQVPPQSTPFDADIGPDSEGEPAVVYSHCGGRHKLDGADCDIYRYSITRNVESKITNADTDTADEVKPTIWKGRVAWVRRYLYRDDPTPYVYTRMLRSPRSQPSQRLPGLPTRRCDRPRGKCASTRGAVEGLELYGRWLALNVTYDYEGNRGVCGRKEIRLDALSGQVRQIADMTCGLDGQSFVGLSFDEGRLYWARYCVASPGDCGDSGAWRYRLSTGDYALAAHGRRLTGFSYVDDGRAYEVRAPDERNGYCGNSIAGEPDQPLCRVVYTEPLAFAGTNARPRILAAEYGRFRPRGADHAYWALRVRAKDPDGQFVSMSHEPVDGSGAVGHADGACGLGGKKNGEVETWTLPMSRLRPGRHRVRVTAESSTCQAGKAGAAQTVSRVFTITAP